MSLMLTGLTFMLESIIKGGRTYRSMGVQRLARSKRSRTYIGTNVQKLAAVEEAIALGKHITRLKNLVEDIEKQAAHQARRVLQCSYDRHA